MKKNKLLIGLSIVFIIGISFGWYYYKKNIENHFVGLWENKSNPSLEQTMDIAKDMQIVISITSEIKDFCEDRMTLTYQGDLASPDKFVFGIEDATRYELEYILSDKLVEEGEAIGLMRSFVDSVIRPHLTDEEMEKYLHIKDGTLNLVIEEPKIIKKMLNISTENKEDTDNKLWAQLILKNGINEFEHFYSSGEKAQGTYKRIEKK
ncbi:hypothetical protein IGI37_002916 [Enterococcus sp. AZ194]|uniref:hypothetical protein n=1 Tax=Enterococcus sp. AZ194 TaxID=2774629 RepID=UPI003F266CD9